MVIVSPPPLAVVTPAPPFDAPTAKVSVEASLPLALAPADTSRPVAFWIAWAPAAEAAVEVRAMLRPSEAVSVRAPVEASATAETPVWLVRALKAVAALRPWVTALTSPAMAPTEMPLMASEPEASEARAIGAEPETVLTAVAVTPVRLDFELMAVDFAAALSAVTPAALVAAETPTSTPLIVKPAPSNALLDTAEPVAWKAPNRLVVEPAIPNEIVWLAFAPTWNCAEANEPSRMFWPLNCVDCAMRCTSASNCADSAFRATRSEAEFVELAD